MLHIFTWSSQLICSLLLDFVYLGQHWTLLKKYVCFAPFLASWYQRQASILTPTPCNNYPAPLRDRKSSHMVDKTIRTTRTRCFQIGFQKQYSCAKKINHTNIVRSYMSKRHYGTTLTQDSLANVLPLECYCHDAELEWLHLPTLCSNIPGCHVIVQGSTPGASVLESLDQGLHSRFFFASFLSRGPSKSC